jgi:hypothetical protein
MPLPETPELERLQAARSQGSDMVGQFIDWLGNQGYRICEYEPHTRRVRPNRLFTNQNGAVYHYATQRNSAAICGAEPMPYTLFSQSYVGSWYSELGSGDVPICSDCMRMITDESNWPEVERIERHLYPVGRGIEEWLALFFQIDLEKVEQERRALIDHVRKAGVEFQAAVDATDYQPPRNKA